MKPMRVLFTLQEGITSDLKNKWGLNKLWKEILKPRFERLETILGDQLIFSSETNKDDCHFAKDYKRIDHRHHALDALVVACTTRSHIKYLNSLNSFSNNKKDVAKYEEWKKWKYLLNKQKQLENKENGLTEFGLPWDSFYLDTKKAVESIIVSHKPTSKLISKAVNKYYKYMDDGFGNFEKKIHLQKPPLDDDKYWVAVRQSLFALPLGTVSQVEYLKNVSIEKAIDFQIKFNSQNEPKWNSENFRIAKSSIRKNVDSVLKKYNNDKKSILNYYQENPIKNIDGENLEKIDLLKFVQYASKRRTIDEKFTPDVIKKMPNYSSNNNWLVNLLLSHLEENKNEPSIAFKGENLEQLHKKSKSKINKVTVLDGLAKNKIRLRNYLLEGVAGVNQYFLVEIKKELDKKTGKEKLVRKYSTPNFLDCIERLAKGLKIHDENPDSQYLILSPGDLVYVPEVNENINQIDWNNKKRIAERTYIMKSSSSTSCYFLPLTISSLIEKGEFESLGKSEKTKELDNPVFIKDNFIKLNFDRLGNIIKIHNQNIKDNNLPSILNEPSETYQTTNPKIQSFKSFDDMENQQIEHFASLSPEESLKNLKKLMLASYGIKKEPKYEKVKGKINLKPRG